MSYDHYALMDDGSLRDGYWRNLEQVRAAGKKAAAAPKGAKARAAGPKASAAGAKLLAEVVEADPGSGNLTIKDKDGMTGLLPTTVKTRFPRGPENAPISFSDIRPGDTIRYLMAGSSAADVHVNVYPSTLLKIRPDDFERLVGELAGRRTCLELSEQQILGDPGYLLPQIRHLRSLGLSIAIDDIGFGRTCLESLVILEPEIVKIDRAERRIGLSIKAAALPDEEFIARQDEMLEGLRPGEDMVDLAGAFEEALGQKGGEEWRPGQKGDRHRRKGKGDKPDSEEEEGADDEED